MRGGWGVGRWAVCEGSHLVEGLGSEVLVVLLSDVAGALVELEGAEGEALALEAGDDFANEATLRETGRGKGDGSGA